MSEKKGIFLKLVLICLCLLPATAEMAMGQGSIGPLQGVRSFYLAGFQSLVRAGDLVYFTVNPPIDPETLWRTDGTAGGTFQLATTSNWPSIFRARFWTVQGSRLFFTAPRSLEPGDLQHRALWRSDGTSESTISMTGGLSFAIDASVGTSPTSLAIPETGAVFFSAGPEGEPVEQLDFELWVTNGTAEGTRLVKDINPEGASKPSFMTAFGGQLFFVADTPQGKELWRSDGTPEGTERVESLHHLDAGILALTRAGDALFLLAETATGLELWRSDGTEAGTSRALELPSSRLLGYATAGQRFFLAVGDASLQDKELWVVEGATGESVQILETSAPGLSKLSAFGNGVLFSLSEAGHGLEPWLSDGTPEGTRQIADICPGPCDSSPGFLGISGGRAMLMADDGDSGHEPWLTDGTAAGTYRAGDLCPGECGSAVSSPGEVGGWLVMMAENQIWLSDGSRDGAFQAMQFSPSILGGAVPLPGRLLVSTSDPAYTPALSALPITAPVPPPQSVWLESARVPGFRFKVQIDGQTVGRNEPACMAQTLCVSGAQPGRSEVFVRVSGRPALVKLTTSAVDVWVLQTATGHLRYYRLNATDPTGSTLDGILGLEGFRSVQGALAGEAKKPRTPQPPGKWIEAKGAPGFRVQARLTSDGQSRILRKEPCMAETFCLGSGTAEVLVRVTGPKPNGYFWPMMARFTPATLEVWVQQRKTGKIRYYKLNPSPAGSSELDGYFDRLGFKK